MSAPGCGPGDGATCSEAQPHPTPPGPCPCHAGLVTQARPGGWGPCVRPKFSEQRKGPKGELELSTRGSSGPKQGIGTGDEGEQELCTVSTMPPHESSLEGSTHTLVQCPCPLHNSQSCPRPVVSGWCGTTCTLCSSVWSSTWFSLAAPYTLQSPG